MNITTFRPTPRTRLSTRHRKAPSSTGRSATGTDSARSFQAKLFESSGAERRGIAERRRVGHHFADQPAGHRSERQTPMRVAERKPQAVMPRRTADDRTRIRKCRARAHPGLADLLAERKQLPRFRQQPLEL